MKGIVGLRSFFNRSIFHKNNKRPTRRAAQGGIEPIPTTAGKGVWATPIAKAAITSGGFSLLGDLIAQTYVNKSKHVDELNHIDAARALRMGSFGLLFYGPYQHWWYKLLGQQWPSRSTSHFLTKVALNQLVLGPLVLSVVFTWNLLLQKKGSELQGKLKRDLVPTMINGWKFWVPAASVNFYIVPIQSQVLYMSACSVLWTAYLSFASYNASQSSELK